MARDHARILTSIWSDPDFRRRTPGAQRLYVLVLSSKGINNAGVAPLLLKKWAKGSVHTTPADLEQPLAELDEHRYLLVDEDTDEVLARSFMRNDGVWRQPNVLKNALREARVTESPTLRIALATELVRIAPSLPVGKGYEGVADMLRETVRELDAQQSANPSSDGSANGSQRPRTNGHTRVVADPSANPSGSRGVGEGVGEGEGASPSRGGRGGGSRAREAAAAPSRPSASGGPPPLPSEIEDAQTATAALAADERPGEHWPEQPCGRRHDPDVDCGRCGRARRAAQDQAAEVSQAEAAELAERRAKVEACGCRRTNGWIEDDEGRPIVRCDHERSARAQLAEALDHAS